mmetsp:Transcript_12581/g.41223  ORF Transcript_12581/g.41223 Transcript_12581/m.41223 type:complete len:590 (+) Transcript_12581:202-1971(+)
MLEAGHDAVCIERSHVIGGVFSTLAESAYDSLYLTISNVFMAYSDFPCKEDYIKYSKKEEYARYLEAYAAHFGLLDKIKFETNVDLAKIGKDGKWTFELTSLKTSSKSTITNVDSLLVCTGSNQVPKKTPENIEKFTGRIMHSVDFQNAAEFEDKRVLIVGVGESAADIASEISTIAKATTVWSRRPFLVAPRYIQIQLETPFFDEFETMGDESLWRKCRVGDFLETGTTSRVANCLPTWVYSIVRHMAWKVMQLADTQPSLRMLGKHCEFATNTLADAKTYLRADQAGWVTKNSRLMQMLANGAVEVVVAKTASFDGQTCTFPDVVIHNDTEFSKKPVEIYRDYDVVVCCTGYTNDFAWLDTENYVSKADFHWCPRTWYKHCWPAGFEKGELAFVGWARPHQGGIPQTAELCARFHGMLLNEERSLPSNYVDLAKQEGQAEEDFYVLSPKLTSLVDWPSYGNSLARMIGCEPRTPSVIFQPITWIKFWLYPLWPCWFRLRGPGAKPDTFDAVMDRFPVYGAKIISDPVTLFIVGPWAIAQKFLINSLAFPITWGLPGAKRLFALFGKSKVNVLHGNRLRLSDLFNWST